MARQKEGPAKRGAFAGAERSYREFDIAVIPCGGEDGKRPLVKWKCLRKMPQPQTLDNWSARFTDANIGILTEPSNLTIIDIDDRNRVAEMVKRCGETRVIAVTPSGGLHLYYRYGRERSVNGLVDGVDVKATGGFVVAPPSKHPVSGNAYQWFEGGPEEFCKLSPVKPQSLPLAASRIVQTDGSRISVGQRNKLLFRFVLGDLAAGNDRDTTLQRAFTWNDLHCDPPLTCSEVEKTARSALRYHESGRNWVGGEPQVIVTKSDLGDFAGSGDAMLLWVNLKAAHGGRHEPFAIVSKAMARADVIPGWSAKKIRRERLRLLTLGKLEQVYTGGKGPGDPHLFRLSNKGADFAPNIIRHPSPGGREGKLGLRLIDGGKLK